VRKFGGVQLQLLQLGFLVFGYGLEFLPWLWFGFFVWYASFGEKYATLFGYWF
jgi:hypothetical protein